MCRLLGYAAPRSTTAAEVLGRADAAEWQRMGRLHADGWGTAWVERTGADATVRRLRDPRDGSMDATLTRALEHDATTARIAHLRLATEGIPAAVGNTHPFVVDGIAFAHNGSVRPIARLRALVRDDEIARVDGATDSAIVVALIMREVDAGVPLLEATTGTVARLRERFPTSALNLLVLSDAELVAVHANAGAPVPHAEFARSGLGDDLPRDHVDHYYRLSWTRLPDGTVALSSSGLATDGWQRMAQHTAVRVDLATLAVDEVAIDDAPAAARASQELLQRRAA